MKYVSYFLLALLCAVSFASCSNDEPGKEDNEQNYIETEILSTITNSDGTYYTLHQNFIRLRKSDGSVIKSLDIDFPEPVVVQKPYGEHSTYYYGFNDFYRHDNSVIIIFTLTDRNSSCLIDGDGVNLAYVFDSNLNSFKKKEFKCGLTYRLDNDDYAVVSSQCDLDVYNGLLEPIKHFNHSTSTLPRLDDYYKPAFGRYNGNYYLLGESRYNNSSFAGSKDAYIVDFNSESTHIVYKPDEYRIYSDFFKEDSHYPRLTGFEYAFVTDHFECIYKYITYAGDNVSVSYKFDFLGTQIFPTPEPMRVGIEWYHFSNIIDSLNQPDEVGTSEENTFLIYYPYGASMTVAAKAYQYDRTFTPDFDIEVSDPSFIDISKTTSRSYNDATTFSLTPKKEGNVDIVFSVPEYNYSETWHLIIRKRN